MKKLVMSLLITALILSLCACGPSDDDDLTATQDSATMQSSFGSACEYIESVVDTSEMTSSAQNDENSFYQYWVYNGNSTYDEFGVDIKLKGKTITLSQTTVSDLEKLGFELQYDNESVEPGSVRGITVSEDEKICNLAVENTSGEVQETADLVVFQFTGNSDGNMMDFDYNGLKIGSSLEDVIQTLGVPKSNITVYGSEKGTSITLSYSNSSTEDHTIFSDSLDIIMMYNAKKQTATLTNLNLIRYAEKLPEETTEE